MHLLDYIIIAAYLIFAIGVGIFFREKASKDSESFFLGGRSLPWWAICLSMIATSFASDTPIWVTEVTRSAGLQRMWWVIIAVLPLIIGIFLFSRLWRRAGIITDAQIYEMRYEGKPAAFLRGFRAFSSGIVQNLLTIGWVTFAMSKVIEVLTPFDQQTAIIICMAIALFYAIFSGFYGVVTTDVVQFFITMGSMLAIAFIAVHKAGGLESVLERVQDNPIGIELQLMPEEIPIASLPESGKGKLIVAKVNGELHFRLFDSSGKMIEDTAESKIDKADRVAAFKAIAPENETELITAALALFDRKAREYGPQTLTIFPDFSTFNTDVIKILVIFLIVWWSDASGYNMQRMAACRNEKDAIKATLFYAIFQSCRPWLWVVVGLVSIAIFPVLGSHSEAYPQVINEYLGIGLKGLLITAFLAAFMSTIDTHLNWGASYLTIDFYQRFVKPGAPQKHYVLVSKIFMILLMLGGYFIVASVQSVTQMMESLSYMLTCGGIVSVLRWFWWRINAWTEITALVGGFIGWGIYSFIGDDQIVLGMPWKEFPWEFKIGLLVSVVFPASLIVTYLTKPVSSEVLTTFFKKVRPGGAWRPIRENCAAVTGSALGKSTWMDVIGGVMLCYGLSLAIGYGILLQKTTAIICLVIAITGGFLVYRWYGAEVARLSNDRDSDE